MKQKNDKRKRLLSIHDPNHLPPWYASVILVSDQNMFEDSYIAQNGSAFLRTSSNDFLAFESLEDLTELVYHLKRIQKQMKE